MLVISDCD